MWVRRPLAMYTAGLLEDKPNATHGERNMIAVAATAQGCTLLIMNELKQKGFTCLIHGRVELVPAARELSRFLSVERSALQTLGLVRRLKPALSLQDYQKAKAQEVEEAKAVEKKATPPPVHVVQTHAPVVEEPSCDDH
jgi:hypothetical protein